MHIAIDDTYGPDAPSKSRFVTGKRRTHVAVAFNDTDVNDVRRQMHECINEIASVIGSEIPEFHFVDMYNRKGVWDRTADGLNLRMFEFFAEIYQSYRWPVLVQTVDKRTISDLKGLERELNFDGLRSDNLGDISLSLLCLKIRSRFKATNEPLTLIIDEGRRKAGAPFGVELFRNWPNSFKGEYASSSMEPLLQIADFFAFCINRNTHLALKGARTEIDQWFQRLVAEMRINCNELVPMFAKPDFSVAELDDFLGRDRALKGIDDI